MLWLHNEFALSIPALALLWLDVSRYIGDYCRKTMHTQLLTDDYIVINGLTMTINFFFLIDKLHRCYAIVCCTFSKKVILGSRKDSVS